MREDIWLTDINAPGWESGACLPLDVSPLALHPRQVSLCCFARCGCAARLLLQLLRNDTSLSGRLSNRLVRSRQMLASEYAVPSADPLCYHMAGSAFSHWYISLIHFKVLRKVTQCLEGRANTRDGMPQANFAAPTPWL